MRLVQHIGQVTEQGGRVVGLLKHKICKFLASKIRMLADLTKECTSLFIEYQRIKSILRGDYIKETEP